MLGRTLKVGEKAAMKLAKKAEAAAKAAKAAKKSAKKDTPAFRGMSANDLADKYNTAQLKKMRQALKRGSMSDKEYNSQIKRFDKSIRNKEQLARKSREDVKRFGTSKQQEVRDREEQDWLAGKDDIDMEDFEKSMDAQIDVYGGTLYYKSGGVVKKKAVAKNKKPNKTKWLFGFKK